MNLTSTILISDEALGMYYRMKLLLAEGKNLTRKNYMDACGNTLHKFAKNIKELERANLITINKHRNSLGNRIMDSTYELKEG